MSAIHASQLSFFAAHAPFDRMEPAHLPWMLERMQLALLCPGRSDRFAGAGCGGPLSGHQAGHGARRAKCRRCQRADTWLELAEGECFPLGALLAHRPVASVYRAGKDTFCYELPVADFHTLLGISAPFRDFCTRRIANLLEHSKQVIQAQYTQSSAEQQSLTSPLSAIIRRAPITCSPQTSVREALEQMHESRIGSMVAVDDAGRPLGILTLPDVLERIALPQIDLEQPVIGVMTTQLTTLPPQALAHEAALVMAKQGFRHVLVVENERLVGLVSEKDLFALQRVGLRQIGSAIRHAQTVEELQQSAADIRSMAHNMMAQGVAAEQLTQFISTFNDLLTVRVSRAGIRRERISARRPTRLCWLALGSEGRFEQTLNTDQDNAMIFTVPEGMDADQVRAQVVAGGAAHQRDAGPCAGFRCATATSWRRIRNGVCRWKSGSVLFPTGSCDGTPEALLHASIFFDFRSVYGAHALAEDLRCGWRKLPATTVPVPAHDGRKRAAQPPAARA